MENLLGYNGLFVRRWIVSKRGHSRDYKSENSWRPLTADGDFHGGRNGHISVEVGRQADESARFVQQDQVGAVARHHPVVQLFEWNFKNMRRNEF